MPTDMTRIDNTHVQESCQGRTISDEYRSLGVELANDAYILL